MTVDIYQIGGPTSWPQPPATYSFSSLSSIERCPRQWQLSRASYGETDGFPSRPGPATIEGLIIHEALELLFRACGFAGMPTVGTDAFVDVVSGLNIGRTIHRFMREREQAIASHPRGAGFRFRRSAAQLANEVIRLFRQQYHPRDTARLVVGHEAVPATSGSVLQALHTFKALPEVKLKHPTLPFTGIIDLVRETSGGATISDFKTGLPSPAHEQQVLAYAVLWWRATGEAPASVEVVYPKETVTRIVSLTQLNATEAALQKRVEDGHALLTTQPAQAKAGSHCGRCDVRQFCVDYWRNAPTPDGEWLDFEATVVGDMGKAEVAISTEHVANGCLVFQAELPNVPRFLSKGAVIRVVGAVRREVDTFELVRTSEVFLVSAEC